MKAWFAGQFTECYSVVVILVCGSFGPVLRYLQACSRRFARRKQNLTNVL
jgi:hypothetical protein